MSDWIQKAKDAANRAAEEAKKLAESAKNVNYGEVFDKTKNMAMQAADEAKKAAGSVMSKDKIIDESEIVGEDPDQNVATLEACKRKLIRVEALLKDIKTSLDKIENPPTATTTTNTTTPPPSPNTNQSNPS